MIDTEIEPARADEDRPSDLPVFPLSCRDCGTSLNEPSDRCPFCGAAILLGPVYKPPRGPLARAIAWLLLFVFLTSMLAVFWLALA